MPHCVAFECNVQAKNKQNDPKIRFHVFPRENELRQAWIHAIGRTSLPKDPRLCSKHFEEHCFKESYLMELRLLESSQARCCFYVIFSQARSPCTSFQCEARREATKAGGVYYFVKLTLTRFLVNSPDSRKNLSFICFQALLEFVVTPFHGPREL